MVQSYRSASAVARFIRGSGRILLFLSVLAGLLVAVAFHQPLGRMACISIGLSVTITLFLISLALGAIGKEAHIKLDLDSSTSSENTEITPTVVPISKSSVGHRKLHMR
jgi:hypothetical protein